MKFKVILVLIFSFSAIAIAQTKIYGSVKDKKGNPLFGANVYLKDSYDGISSNEDGKFSFITDETGDGIIIISYIGYKSQEVKVTLTNEPIELNIILEEEASMLGTVVISAGSFEASDEKKGVVLKPLDIVTTAGATADIYGALTTLPGTQKVGETEGLFVRGGSAAEAKTIIDEMVVQNPYFSSVPDIPQRGRFSPFLFSGTVFSTGGYSAKYGQALSSTLILKTSDVAQRTFSSVSVMAVGLGAVHTQKFENSSLSVSSTYTNLRPYLKVQPTRADWKNPPEGIEGSVIYRHKISKSGTWKFYSTYSKSDLSLYTENLDNLSQKDLFDLSSGKFYLNTSYNDVLNDDWTMFTGTSYSYDKDKIFYNTGTINTNEYLLQGKTEFSRRILSNSFLTFGAEAHKGSYNAKLSFGENNVKDFYYASYAEADVFFTNDVAARLGVRYEHSDVIKKNNFAPRVSLAWKVADKSQINFAYGNFYQTPERRYLFEQKDFDFEKAIHYILNYQFINDSITFRIEGYYKDYDNLVKNNSGGTSPRYSNNGDGYAKGIEIFWRDKQTFKYVDYWVSYSFLDTKRDYRDFPVLATPTFAAAHTLSIVYKHWVPSIMTYLGFTYSFATGRTYRNPNNPVFLGDKTDGYSNLSFNASYLTTMFGGFTIVYFSLDNLLGTENIFGYRYSSDGSIRREIVAPTLRSAFIGMFLSFDYQ